ncbi:MAG: WD40 repeat domain-containing protein [Nitrososphaera sp.]
MTRWYLGDNATAIAWSPDCKRVATALASGKVKVFEVNADDAVCRLDGHRFGAMGVAWSPDGSTIATAGQDGKAHLYDTSSASLIKTLQGGGAQWVEQIAWSPDGRHLATAAGKSLRLWTDRGDLVYEFKDHRSTVSAMQWQYAGDRIATACYGAVLFFSTKSPKPCQELEWQSSLISLVWSPDGKYVAAGTQEASVYFCKLVSKDRKDLTMSGYETKVKELAWERKSRFLATGGGRQITIWDIVNGPEGSMPQVLRHLFRVTHLAYQRSGDLLVSGSKEGFVAFWRPEESKVPVREIRLGADILAARWSPDEASVAVCTADGYLAVLETPPEK